MGRGAAGGKGCRGYFRLSARGVSPLKNPPRRPREAAPGSPVPFHLFLFFPPSFPFLPTENLRGGLRRECGCLGIHLAESEGKLPVCLLPAGLTTRQGPANPRARRHRLAERGRAAAAASPPRPRMRGPAPAGRGSARGGSAETEPLATSTGEAAGGALGLPARSAASPPPGWGRLLFIWVRDRRLPAAGRVRKEVGFAQVVRGWWCATADYTLSTKDGIRHEIMRLRDRPQVPFKFSHGLELSPVHKTAV